VSATELARRLALIVVTDERTGGRDVVDVVRAALRGGAPSIQLRSKTVGGREMVELAERLLPETRAAGALLWVNDRVDIALAAGADGAHVGDDDLPIAAARRICPAGFLLGRSADTPEVALQAQWDGADYVGVGPVYPTATKADAGAPVGLERITRVRAAVGIPVVGIGGIDAANAREVIHVGAHGVAVVSAVMLAPDPEQATRDILAALTRGAS
jgi:thiamine-phosphate pyrophosphorylase